MSETNFEHGVTYNGFILEGDYAPEMVETAKGDPCMNVYFQISDVLVGDEMVPLSDEQMDVILMPFYLSAASWQYTIPKLKKLGFNMNFLDIRFDDNMYCDGTTLKCKHEDYNGRTTVKFDIYTPPKKVEESVLEALNRKLASGADAANVTAPGRKVAPQRKQRAAPPPSKAASKTSPPPSKKEDEGKTNLPQLLELAVDKASAWNYWFSFYAGVPNSDDWNTVLEETASLYSITEDRFTAVQWQVVAEHANQSLPF